MKNNNLVTAEEILALEGILLVEFSRRVSSGEYEARKGWQIEILRNQDEYLQLLDDIEGDSLENLFKIFKKKKGGLSFLKDNGFIVIKEKGFVRSKGTMPSYSYTIRRTLETTKSERLAEKWGLISIKSRIFYVSKKPSSAYLPKFFREKKKSRNTLHFYKEEITHYLLSRGLKQIETPYDPRIPVPKLFDELLIPLHHPARGMQDLIYSEQISEYVISKKTELLHTAHPLSGLGYEYTGDKRVALRSHLTPYSLAALKKNHEGFFTISKVFRRETEDQSHLCEFHQVEINFPQVGARGLLNFIKEFLRFLGLDGKTVPSYFPYTSPSFEIYCKNPSDSTWQEVGGCGIFKEELEEVFELKSPTMAMGFGLERLIMVKEGLSDIRDIYE